MESLPAEEKTEDLKSRRIAEHVASGLIEGNLLLPQAYEAIGVCGAKAIVEQVLEGYQYDEVCDSLHEQCDLIAERLAEVMLTAHHARGVGFSDERFEDQEQFLKFMSGHVHTHLEFAKNAVKEVSTHTYDVATKSASFEKGLEILQLVVSALKDQSLRADLKEYNELAKNRANGLQRRAKLHQIKVTWKKIFMTRLSVHGLEGDELDKLFDELTLTYL